MKMPYSGARHVPERSGGPDSLEDGGIEESLHTSGVEAKPTCTVRLLAEEDPDAW